MTKKSNKLVIFTKSPVLGEVKTRLQPVYSVEQSLQLHKYLTLKTLSLTETLTGFDIELCCTPNRNTSYFLECENKYPVTLGDQQGSDLGERMAFSVSVALQTYNKVIVIGTDCPSIDQGYIEQAIQALDENDAVIGPAADGGYVLLGLRAFSLELFKDITWGSDQVLNQTKIKLDNLDWSYHELAIMHDIDRPEDVQRHQDLLDTVI